MSAYNLQAFETLNDRFLGELNGYPFDRYRKELRALAERGDWQDVLGLPDKTIFAARSRFLYRHLTRTAYMKHRVEQLRVSGFSHLVYRDGDCPCHGHAQLDGIVLPAQHPFWGDFMPMNDWGCGCYPLGARSAVSARWLGGGPDKQPPTSWDDPSPAAHRDLGLAPEFVGNRTPSMSDALDLVARGDADHLE